MNYFNYFSEIEELFIRRRGRNLLLSPLDWALIETWQERGVPLHIILGGIERVFDSVDKQPARRQTVKSLLYCKDEIEAQYAGWLERQVGNGRIQSAKLAAQDAKPETHGAQPPAHNNSANEPADAPKSALFSDEALVTHLERVAAEIEFAQASLSSSPSPSLSSDDFQATLAAIAQRLEELGRQPSHTAESLEESLERLDALLDESLRRNFETAALQSEVEKQIASHKSKMEREVYQRTFDLMLLKRLREQTAIPRLSLFNL